MPTTTDILLKTQDHPEANGRSAQYGDQQWRLTFPLERGNRLELRIGKTARESLVSMLAQEEADDKWVTAEEVNEQCWWWWWNGDEDACPVPVSVMHSCTGAGLTDGVYFASQGQLGWNRPQDVTEMGGCWMKIIEPPIPTLPKGTP